ncbi:sensor histidine kinase [Paenibacillus kobensis]|uniref:sensor histidine kinase n=1 Tax=Paenibacillus kobensis TaxID=59841 RepID=UPI000FDB1886|nr:HAMP domain-containing sensor histidine kinase [Paenibacillus kobensis]
MKGIDRLTRFYRLRIVGVFVSVITIVMLTWTGLYYVAAYVTDGLNRDDMREELRSDMSRAVELLEAADVRTDSSGGSGAASGADNANGAVDGGEVQSGQVERASRLLQAFAGQNEIALAMQQPGGEWILFGEGSDRLAEWMGVSRTADSGEHGVWTAANDNADNANGTISRAGGGATVGSDGTESSESAGAVSTERFSYQWSNPFHPRVTALIAEVQGAEGQAYKFAVGKPLAAWNSHYMYALAPQLLFMLLLIVVSAVAAPWQHQIIVLQTMVDAMKRIAAGDFSVAISPHRRMGEMTIIAEELSDMASGLKELEETRQRFISDVSHELQSPLTSIAGFARALHNESLPQETRHDYLSMIEAESGRLSKLSDSLLRLTMLEARRGLAQAELTVFPLDLQLKRTALAVEPLWLAKQLELDIEVEPVTLSGDEDALRQVWTNLLHNAIKFTPERGTIRIGLRQEQEEAVVVIADTGIGIAADDLSHVFERFYKADKARTSAKGGSGLGLSIAATIVRQHQGTIAADSKPGEGTVFTVRLPLKPEAAAPAVVQEKKPKRTLQEVHDQHKERKLQRWLEHLEKRKQRRGK